MPDEVGSTIKLADLEASMKLWGKGWATDMLTELQKLPLSVKAGQDPVKVEATVDDKPIVASLVKPEQADMKAAGIAGLVKPEQADMKAAGIAGLVESGDHIKVLKFELGPITSALVGIPTGMLLSGVTDKWVLPYRDAAGEPTATRPAKIGFKEVNLLNPGIKIGEMVLAETFVAGFLGRTAAHFIAGTLLVDILLAYTPLGTWLEDWITSLGPKTTAAQGRAQNRGLNAAQAAAQAETQRLRHPASNAQNGRRSLAW